MVWVVAGGMKDGNADGSVGVYCNPKCISKMFVIVRWAMRASSQAQVTSESSQSRTVRVPHATSDKFHRRRAQGVVSWELQLCCENAALEGGFFWALNQGFPIEHVIFGDGTGGDTLWWVGGEVLVFVEKALLSDGGRHFRYLID